MFFKKIIRISLFTVIFLLSLTFIFLASCSTGAPEELEENAPSAIKEEEKIEEITEDATETVDSKLSEDFTDMKGIKEVTINMIDISFEIPEIIIDSGTTITWVNQDNVGHTVNSDPHPGHDNHPDLNSDLLSKGDTYSYAFDEPGLYTYHCSPHYSRMKGSVLVE
ncbi:MAG: plastocyanin/azurin family copper-binding protein [Candidatus Mariimomonas ferrooxydans]